MKITERLLNLLYPPKCPFCRRILPDAHSVCSCADSLPVPDKTALVVPFQSISACYAPFEYEGAVRDSLHRYKFGGLRVYSASYSAYLQKTVDENNISCDIITWVPLSRKRRRTRGYDQAELLARGLADLTGAPCMQLLQKIRDNPAQSGAPSARARAQNVSGVYSAENTEQISGKRILLVDDIITTGATVGECASVLRAAGAAAVYAIAVAKTPANH